MSMEDHGIDANEFEHWDTFQFDCLQFDGNYGQYEHKPRRKGFTDEDRCTWQTKTEGRIPIKDMTDDHLLNTIHMIETKKIFTPAWGGLLFEAGRRKLQPNVPEAIA